MIFVGFIASTAILDTKAAKIGLVEQENSQTLQPVETPLSFEEDKSCKGQKIYAVHCEKLNCITTFFVSFCILFVIGFHVTTDYFC